MAPSLCAYQVPYYFGADSTPSCLNHDIFIVFIYYKYVCNNLKLKSLSSAESAELRESGVYRLVVTPSRLVNRPTL
jgi:hypothetical protein